jgi:hypothetical protein
VNIELQVVFFSLQQLLDQKIELSLQKLKIPFYDDESVLILMPKS